MINVQKNDSRDGLTMWLQTLCKTSVSKNVQHKRSAQKGKDKGRHKKDLLIKDLKCTVLSDFIALAKFLAQQENYFRQLFGHCHGIEFNILEIVLWSVLSARVVGSIVRHDNTNILGREK